MEYINQLEYTNFLSEQIMEQAEMERYINECLLMAEGKNVISNMALLNESVSDKFKEAIKKIIEAIGRMWGKFLEAVATLVNNNKSYLEKYKKIILEKKVADDVTYTMYDYPEGINRMVKVPVPMFNYDAMKEKLDDEKEFIESAGTLKQCLIQNSDAAYIDQCKAYFRGSADPKPIKGNLLKMTDLYTYCYEYENKIKVQLEKDLNEIKKASNDAAATIDEAERNKPAAPAENAENKDVKESFSWNDEPKMYYSNVYEQYIEEATPLTIQHGDSSSAGTPNDNTSVAKNMKNVDDTNKPDSNAQTAALKDDTTDYEKKVKRIQTYLNVCGGVLAAKQTVSEEIFKAYMQIIRDHVRTNVGTSKKDTSNDKVADPGTNYKSVVDKAFGGGEKPTEPAKPTEPGEK